MMNYRFFVALLLISFISLVQTEAVCTGPSSMSSEIIPISINEKGEILCKTRFHQNTSGALHFTLVRYGFCVIAEGEIIQYAGKTLDPDEIGSKAYSLMNYYDAIFKSETTPKQLKTIVGLLGGKYHFVACNASAFLVNQKMSIEAFERKEGIILKNTPQLALYGAKSTHYYPEQEVQVVYNFGSVIFLENYGPMEPPRMGAAFDYAIQKWENSEGDSMSLGFDFNDIIGVLIKK